MSYKLKVDPGQDLEVRQDVAPFDPAATVTTFTKSFDQNLHATSHMEKPNVVIPSVELRSTVALNLIYFIQGSADPTNEHGIAVFSQGGSTIRPTKDGNEVAGVNEPFKVSLLTVTVEVNK